MHLEYSLDNFFLKIFVLFLCVNLHRYSPVSLDQVVKCDHLEQSLLSSRWINLLKGVRTSLFAMVTYYVFSSHTMQGCESISYSPPLIQILCHFKMFLSNFVLILLSNWILRSPYREVTNYCFH